MGARLSELHQIFNSHNRKGKELSVYDELANTKANIFPKLKMPHEKQYELPEEGFKYKFKLINKLTRDTTAQ